MSLLLGATNEEQVNWASMNLWWRLSHPIGYRCLAAMGGKCGFLLG